MGRVVLVTGVARFLGGRLARRLADTPGVDRVVGVDVVAPPDGIGGAEFVRADIRNPVIARVIDDARVDAVVHLSVLSAPPSAGGRSLMKEVNVIGTMQLLAACQQAPRVTQLVVKSSTTVYGASAKDPALFTEDMEPLALPRSGYAKDSVEVEGYVRGFARRRPDVAVSVLRCANVVGPRIHTPTTAYFELPVVPTVLGFDPRLQFAHEDDVLDVLTDALLRPLVGTYNVAGDGVLSLSQAAHRAGRATLPLPEPVLAAVAGLVRGTGLVDLTSEHRRYLTYGRGVDTAALADAGFSCRYTTAGAFADFAAARCGAAIGPGPAPLLRLLEALR